LSNERENLRKAILQVVENQLRDAALAGLPELPE
jgi:hypothetical protein